MADIPQYPLMFDSSQWLNKYSPYSGQAIPFPASYRGAPTDAHGNQIQSYLDTQAKHDAWSAANPAPTQAAPVTLNTSPISGNPNPVGTPLNPTGDWSVLAPDLGMGAQTQANYAYDLGLPGSAYNGYTKAPWAASTGASTGATQPATAAATNPYDMNQAYKDALANPGHVTTPGATVPQSAPPSNQSGVLQQFLANWNKGGGQTKGAGNYDNSGFFKALQGQV